MIHVVVEGIKSLILSISFGMDDKYDRLIRKTTILMVLFGALIIASNRYFGAPISCSTNELPISISQHWLDTFCWMTDKKFAPIQFIGDKHTRKTTSFYQFTVETLVLIAVILSIPAYSWKFVLRESGFNLKTIATLIAATKQTIGPQRATYIIELANHIQISRRYHRFHLTFDEDLAERLAHLRTSPPHIHRRRYVCYQNRYFIPVVYIIIKIMYISAIVITYMVLQYCLGFKYVYLGFPILDKIRLGNTTTFLDERFFPQRTWCLISRPKLGGSDETWADCLLPINIINNIVFSLLWFWLLIITLSSIYGLFRTIYNMSSSDNKLFLGHHLRAHNHYHVRESAAVTQFIEKLPLDIILILRLYEAELDKNLVGEIIVQLFLMFKKEHSSLDVSIDVGLP